MHKLFLSLTLPLLISSTGMTGTTDDAGELLNQNLSNNSENLIFSKLGSNDQQGDIAFNVSLTGNIESEDEWESLVAQGNWLSYHLPFYFNKAFNDDEIVYSVDFASKELDFLVHLGNWLKKYNFESLETLDLSEELDKLESDLELGFLVNLEGWLEKNGLPKFNKRDDLIPNIIDNRKSILQKLSPSKNPFSLLLSRQDSTAEDDIELILVDGNWFIKKPNFNTDSEDYIVENTEQTVLDNFEEQPPLVFVANNNESEEIDFIYENWLIQLKPKLLENIKDDLLPYLQDHKKKIAAFLKTENSKIEVILILPKIEKDDAPIVSEVSWYNRYGKDNLIGNYEVDYPKYYNEIKKSSLKDKIGESFKNEEKLQIVLVFSNASQEGNETISILDNDENWISKYKDLLSDEEFFESFVLIDPRGQIDKKLKPFDFKKLNYTVVLTISNKLDLLHHLNTRLQVLDPTQSESEIIDDVNFYGALDQYNILDSLTVEEHQNRQIPIYDTKESLINIKINPLLKTSSEWRQSTNLFAGYTESNKADTALPIISFDWVSKRNQDHVKKYQTNQKSLQKNFSMIALNATTNPAANEPAFSSGSMNNQSGVQNYYTPSTSLVQDMAVPSEQQRLYPSNTIESQTTPSSLNLNDYSNQTLKQNDKDISTLNNIDTDLNQPIDTSLQTAAPIAPRDQETLRKDLERQAYYNEDDLAENNIRVILEPFQRTILSAQISTPILSSQVSAVVKRIYKQMGESFEKDEPIMEIDRSLFSANLERAKVALDRSETVLIARRKLYADSIASLQELKDAETAVAGSYAEYVLAKNQYDAALIRGPYNGRVVTLLIHENELPQPGQALVEVLEDQRIIAKALVPAQFYPKLKIGKIIPIYITELDRTFNAKIIRIGSVIEPSSQTVAIDAEIDNKKHELLPGMTGRTTIK